MPQHGISPPYQHSMTTSFDTVLFRADQTARYGFGGLIVCERERRWLPRSVFPCLILQRLARSSTFAEVAARGYMRSTPFFNCKCYTTTSPSLHAACSRASLSPRHGAVQRVPGWSQVPKVGIAIRHSNLDFGGEIYPQPEDRSYGL